MNEPTAARMLACLGDFSRFRLVTLLQSRRICVTELAMEVGLSQSCTTRHLQALERAGLVIRRREGRRVTYGLSTEQPAVADLIAWALGREPDSTPASLRPATREIPDQERAVRRRPEKLPADSSVEKAPSTESEGPRWSDLEDFLL